MADTTLPGVLLTGDHASRPAATAVATGTLYACSTHDLIYQSDGSSWATWSDVSGASVGVLTTAGDILYRDGSGLQRLAIGTAGQVLTVNGGATAPSWTAAAGGGGSGFGLDRSSFDGTYGDDFTGASLNAKWSRHNQTAGEETYQDGGAASALRVAYSTAAASRYIYQTAPNGANETWETSVSWWQTVTSNQMFALLMVDSSGNGVAALVYDTSNGVYLVNVASHAYSSILNQVGTIVPTSYYQGGGRMWLQLRKASGVYYARASFDGETWSREATGTPSAFTPARVGIGRILGTQSDSVGAWHWFDKTA